MYFNRSQAKGLANFFFDLAKGLVLGGLGLSLTIPGGERMFLSLSALLIAGFCVMMAIELLEENG